MYIRRRQPLVLIDTFQPGTASTCLQSTQRWLMRRCLANILCKLTCSTCQGPSEMCPWDNRPAWLHPNRKNQQGIVRSSSLLSIHPHTRTDLGRHHSNRCPSSSHQESSSVRILPRTSVKGTQRTLHLTKNPSMRIRCCIQCNDRGLHT